MANSYKINYPTAGSILSGSNGTSYTTAWTQPTTNFNNSNGTPVMTIPHGENKVVLEDKATLEVKGSVKINGLDLEERLSTIETVLQIPTRDVILESKYPKLKELYKQYMKELEKYKTFERLKGNENTTTS